MATLNDDSDSWRAHSLIRRNFRQSRVDPESPTHAVRGRKDTKTWCRGKEGREHVVETVIQCYRPEYCEKRGSHSGYCYKTRCANCGMDRYRLPKKSTNPRQVELAEKWCHQGHLYDWLMRGECENLGIPVRFSMWSSRLYEFKVCVMCGKTTGSRRRAQESP